jgi:hypothetical protein
MPSRSIDEGLPYRCIVRRTSARSGQCFGNAFPGRRPGTPKEVAGSSTLMNEERVRVLEMVRGGKDTTEEGARPLEALKGRRAKW